MLCGRPHWGACGGLIMEKKTFVRTFFCFLTVSFFIGCSQPNSDSSSGTDNPVHNPLAYLSGQYASISYDITNDVLTKKISASYSSRTVSTENNEDESEDVEFIGQITTNLRKGLINFNDYISREGFPVIHTGSFNVDLSITDTTVKGTISSENAEMDGKIIKFYVTYDLYLEKSLWRGKMNGSVTIGDKTSNIEYDYDTPILTKLVVVPLDENNNETSGKVINGGKVKVKIGVNSNAPVNWINTSWNSPEKNLEGGGCGTSFTEVSNGYWEYNRIYEISKFQPSGEYKWDISVGNAAELTSETKNVSIQVENTSTAEKPTIEKAYFETDGLSSGNGGTATLFIIAESKSPISFLSLSLEGPTENIEGGGCGVSFNKKDANTYEYSRTWTFSKWDPNGLYTLRNLVITTEGDIDSDPYDELTFEIKNNSEASTPIITNIEIRKCISPYGAYDNSNINGTAFSAANIEGNLYLALVITATSDAPINWINSSFYGPTVNLNGGGSGITSTKISENTWQIVLYDSVSSPYYAPKGKYYWNGISVRNEGRKTSNVWNEELYFTLTE